ncbi:MAG: YfhO family protein [Bacteroidetes bacterium]|nr:YfhO family protein [Bacteroidota bacterium]
MRDKKKILNTLAPYLVAIFVFIGITLVYFSPLLEGKKLKQHDIAMFKGMSKEIVDFRESTGQEALWTNSMFGGMPAWQISVKYTGNLMGYVDRMITLGLPYPANFVFLYFLGFFILLLVLKVDPWLSIAGAIAFALSSYFFIILGAGHTSKAHAIGYMAPVLAGIILTFRGKYWQGALLTAVALALEIKAGHLQITYYLLLMVLVYGFFKLIDAITQKTVPSFLKTTGILLVAALLAVLTHSTNLWATYQYGKDTMRGKPELTKEIAITSDGLDRDYITSWSYGKEETWSLLIPDAKGGASGMLGNVDAIKKADPAYRSMISNQTNAYWGDQPGTSGPVYVGAIVIFLFILGMLIVRGRFKWALFSITVLSILLSWGHNMMWFTDFFIDYIPGYNKFRAVTMTLVMAELAMPLLAFLALNEVIKNPVLLKQKINYLYISLGLSAGVVLLFYMLPTAFFSFLSEQENAQFTQLLGGADGPQVAAYLANLEAVRVAIFRADALRSLFFIVAAAALIYFYLLNKIKRTWLIAGVAVLVLIDMFGVNRRYLNNDNFVRASQVDVPFKPSKANLFILNDKDPDFRVLDITQSTFNDASTSYFHKSIGGYHGAKLQRYQDIIEYYMQGEIESIYKVLSDKPTMEKINNLFYQQQVLNMLNTKYVIYNPDGQPLINPAAFGGAWFVDTAVVVNSPDEEIAALAKVDLRTVAVVDQRFAKQLARIGQDDESAIQLTDYQPNHLTYQTESAGDRLAVFSEIYFANGWNAYLDGVKAPYLRANYILRAMNIPAGKHTVDFKFEPAVWKVGEPISLVASLILILLMLTMLGMEARKYFKK